MEFTQEISFLQILGSLLFGLIIGSFQNAVIFRVPRKIPLTNPKRSICTNCNKEIQAADNIPILSWIALRGKCRNCGIKISARYPLVELTNAFLALGAVSEWGFNLTGLFAYLLLSILLSLSLIDIEHLILPDKINKPGIILGLILGAVNSKFHLINPPFSQSLEDSLFGCILGYGILYIVAYSYYLVSKVHGLGGGDLKFMAFMGSLLGPTAIIPTLITGSLLGVCFAILGMIFRKVKFRAELPFGPWLALATALFMFGFDSTQITTRIINSLIMPSN